MTKVTAEISTSLDGYVAGANASLENPLGEGGERLHEWAIATKTFREHHGMDGGETGPDDELFAESVARQGAVVMGRKMFSGGAGPWADDPNPDGWWGDEPPFHKPVFVLTHHDREPLALGETTFTFVTDGIASAVEQARAAAGENDVHVAGGAETIQNAIRAGLLEELTIHLTPILLGGGVPLLAGLGAGGFAQSRVVGSPAGVAHLTYRISS
jgi:dihydrofolate reductase